MEEYIQFCNKAEAKNCCGWLPASGTSIAQNPCSETRKLLQFDFGACQPQARAIFFHQEKVRPGVAKTWSDGNYSAPL
jgi:hypothetical protein